jgi:hypothetical protein
MFFLPLVKADQEQRLIYARAAAEEPDKSREIMDYVSARPQFEAWSNQFREATLGKSLGNIRAMHNPRHLAGKVQEIAFDDANKTVDVVVKVLDPVDWAKIEEGGYTGLSIGGGYLKKWQDGELTRYTPRIAEISLVDSPCIPSARIMELQKADGAVEEVLLKGHPHSFAELLPPPTFGDLMMKGRWLDVAKPLASKVGPTIEHGAEEVADHFVSRGKIFRPAKEPLAIDHYTGRSGNKIVASPVPKGREVSYTSRGKTYTHFIDDEAEKADAVGALRKAAASAERDKVRQVMHEFKHGKLRSWRGLNAKGRPRKGPKVTDRKQAVAIALSQARRRAGVAKSDINAAIDERMEKWVIPTAMAIGGAVGGAKIAGKILRKPVVRALRQRADAAERWHLFPGAYNEAEKHANRVVTRAKRIKAGAAAGGALVGMKIGQAIQARQKDPAELRKPRYMTKADPATIAAELQKRAETRVETAKARWLDEGHHDVDPMFDAKHEQAIKAVLGRDNKVASVAEERGHFWHGVADAQDAYDKVRPQLPAEHHVMVEVAHQHGLLYNPEGVGEHHVDAQGRFDQPLHLLHPSEADDYIAHHGKAAKAVKKMAPPRPAVTDIRQLGAIAGWSSGRITRLQAAA